MARSEEALRRRAEKRGRTVEEQRRVDALADQKKEKQQQAQPEKASIPSKDVRLEEPGAWKCPKCDNHNFASRRTCHSATCSQTRPSTTPCVPSPQKKKQKHNHRQLPDGTTDTITSTWNIPVADTATLATNQILRQRFLETNGEGMTEQEQERAKILIARDERKRQKKLQQQQSKQKKQENDGSMSASSSSLSCPKSIMPEQQQQPSNANNNADGNDQSSSSSPQTITTKVTVKKKNKTPRNLEKHALLQRYLDSRNGSGMSTEEQDRAKILLARQERRAQRRRQEQLVQKQTDHR